jgi:hypothetical protein
VTVVTVFFLCRSEVRKRKKEREKEREKGEKE